MANHQSLEWQTYDSFAKNLTPIVQNRRDIHILTPYSGAAFPPIEYNFFVHFLSFLSPFFTSPIDQIYRSCHEGRQRGEQRARQAGGNGESKGGGNGGSKGGGNGGGGGSGESSGETGKQRGKRQGEEQRGQQRRKARGKATTGKAAGKVGKKNLLRTDILRSPYIKVKTFERATVPNHAKMQN